MRRLPLLLLAAMLALAALAPAGRAADDPAGCTDGVRYDPTVPTWDAYFAAHPEYGAIVPFASGAPGRSTGKNTTANLDRYFDAVTAAVATNPRVRVKKFLLGTSELGGRGVPGRDIAYWVVSTPGHIASFEADGRFWAGVRDGTVSQADGLAAARTKPVIGWVTATPHGNEPAAGEAIVRQLYELVARTDCANARRLQNMDVILDPVRNPDGRDNNVRTTAFGFDPNRDFGVRNYKENAIFLPEITKYPGVFFIDAHQQGSGYFFPPNEDPVHHEISSFSLDFIQHQIGPKLQQTFNDQSGQYQNYNSYDLFTPEYGDTVPSLLMGAAGMTYEKGADEAYGKQVYDHYLAIDTTINLTVNDKVGILSRWVRQWPEAVAQGRACQLQPNKLVSPLHDTINQQPDIDVCGYFFRPDAHTGDLARLLRALQEVGVKVYSLDSAVGVAGLHEYGKADTTGTLPRGTLYIPMGQAQKHWIQAVLGEDPFIPYNYYYDVVTWSYGLQRGLAGDGFLTRPLAPGARLTELGPVALGSAPAGAPAVYAFDTDAMEGLALAVDLLDAGVNVFRAERAFDAGGIHYASGAALVDARSLRAGGVDLDALAAKRDTPVRGLDAFPVAHRQLTRPKIGLYTGAATVPTNPLDFGGGTGQCTATAFCEALFVLREKDELPAATVVPVTSADLESGALVSGGFTALVDPGYTVAAGPGTAALQAFVNTGGRYVGTNAGGTATARNAGVTTLDTTTIPGLLTPGSTFDGRFDTANPVGWGFDRGGWIYRDSTSNPVYDPATLGSASAVVTYAPAPMRSYGFSLNALGPGQLGGRPAVVDAPLGGGHAVLFGFNPFYRSWKEQDERLVLNAILYPAGAALPPSAPRRATAVRAPRRIAPATRPVAAGRLRSVASRPLKVRNRIDRDVLIRVRRGQVRKLRAAVRAARLGRRLTRRVSYKTTRRTATLRVRRVRRADEHARKPWVDRIMAGLGARGVRPRFAQL